MCFPNICTNRCTRSSDLVCYNIFFFRSQFFCQFNDLYRKLHGAFCQFIFPHRYFFPMPRRAHHFRRSRNIIAQHIICRRQTSLRIQCAHHSAARRNCSCMMFCCAEMRLLRNEVCAMRKMMCADAHSFMPRRAHHFRRSRNIIAQHIICRRQTSLRIQCAHHSAARRINGAMALASPCLTIE